MFSLNRQERQIALFLATVALIGMGVNLLAKTFLPFADARLTLQDIAKINLNNADKDLLMVVPGIKEKLAQRIIDYREENGGFSQIEELKQVKGITNLRYEKIKNSFCIR